MKRRMQLSIISLIAAIATIFSGGTALAQASPTTAPTTTVPAPSVLSVKLPDRPKNCTKQGEAQNYAAKLQVVQTEIDMARADKAVAEAYEDELDELETEIKDRQHGMPSWCAVAPTTTKPLPRPKVLDDPVPSRPSNCKNANDVSAYIDQLSGLIARIDAAPKGSQHDEALAEMRANVVSKREGFRGACAEKGVNVAPATTPPATKAPSKTTDRRRVKARQVKTTVQPPAASPKVKRVYLEDNDWVEVHR